MSIVRSESLRVFTICWAVSLIGGCIPSPHTPLGGKADSVETPAKPVADVTPPVFQPPIVDTQDSAASSAESTLALPVEADDRLTTNFANTPPSTPESTPPPTQEPMVATDSSAEHRVAPILSDSTSRAAIPLVPKQPASAADDVATRPAPDASKLTLPNMPSPHQAPESHSESQAELGLAPAPNPDPDPDPDPDPQSTADTGTQSSVPDRLETASRGVTSVSERSFRGSPRSIAAPLIPREKFFGNPQRLMARISPDGKSLAYIAPHDGVLNVFVAPSDDPAAARPVTDDKGHGIQEFFWAFTSRHILFLQDTNADENDHVFAVNLDTNETRDLTPIEDIAARVLAVSSQHPAEIVVGINDRPPHQYHDVHQINIVTGEHHKLLENPGFARFVIDDDYQIRFGMKYTEDGGMVLLESDSSADDGWRDFMRFGPEDSMTSRIEGFSRDADQLYIVDSRDRNTGALRLLDLNQGTDEWIAENERADVGGILVHPTEKHVQAVTFDLQRRKWKILDPRIDDDLEYLHSVEDGEIDITSRTLDDQVWTVVFEQDDGPAKYYLYHREPRATKFLFSSRPDLESLPLVPMHPLQIPSADGRMMTSYLSLPPGSDDDNNAMPDEPLPMVLLVHGGPWTRDHWGYNPVHQLLANRGYAVLSVNFRGSMGFGKDHLNAGNREWAGKMHADLIDAVHFAVNEKIADESRIGIMGGSYGGYAALVGLAFTPDVFACGVDIVGPSNLVTLLGNPPPYWVPFMSVLTARVGDCETASGREFLMSRSPISRIDQIRRPLLIGQCAQDPFIKQADTDQLVRTLTRNEIPVTYVVYPHEGHGLQSPEDRLAFYAITEAFLARQLGGRYQPLDDALEAAACEIPVGRDLLNPF